MCEYAFGNGKGSEKGMRPTALFYCSANIDLRGNLITTLDLEWARNTLNFLLHLNGVTCFLVTALSEMGEMRPDGSIYSFT